MSLGNNWTNLSEENIIDSKRRSKKSTDSEFLITTLPSKILKKKQKSFKNF